MILVRLLVGALGGAVVAMCVAVPASMAMGEQGTRIGPYAPAAVGAFVLSVIAAAAAPGVRAVAGRLFKFASLVFFAHVGLTYLPLDFKPPEALVAVRDMVRRSAQVPFLVTGAVLMVIGGMVTPGAGTASPGRAPPRGVPAPTRRARAARGKPPQAPAAAQQPAPGIAPAAGNPVLSGRSGIDLIRRG